MRRGGNGYQGNSDEGWMRTMARMMAIRWREGGREDEREDGGEEGSGKGEGKGGAGAG